MARPIKKRRGNVFPIDFTGVKSGGAAVPDGRYVAKITAVEQKEGKTSGEPYLEITWEITSKKCNGREVRFDNYSLQPQALWRIKSMLEAMGVDVPDGEQDIDFDELISDGTECIVEITAQTSDDGERKYARVTGHSPLDDGNTVDDEEDDPKARKAGRETPRGTRSSSKDEGEEDEEPPKRRSRKEEDEEPEEDPPSKKKIKKGATVKFKNEKNKLTKGTIDSIDGSTATVVTDDDDTYEIDIDELTVV